MIMKKIRGYNFEGRALTGSKDPYSLSLLYVSCKCRDRVRKSLKLLELVFLKGCHFGTHVSIQFLKLFS